MMSGKTAIVCMASLAPFALQAAELRQSHPVGVVELFTSQGCSSCPKADAAMEKIANGPDVVTVTYHVDYWNYLGWQDTLSSKENTARQYAYAKTLGNSNVYTPQIVLNGVEDIKSSEPSLILAKLDALKAEGRGVPVPVTATMSDSEMTISIGEGTGAADVVIAYFNKQTRVGIESGENQGRQIVYRNAVTNLETIGMWDGKAMSIKLPAAVLAKGGHDGCAILLQSHDADGNPGRILGAAAL